MVHAAVFPRGGMKLKPATATREEAYGDPTPQNVNFLVDQNSQYFPYCENCTAGSLPTATTRPRAHQHMGVF